MFVVFKVIILVIYAEGSYFSLSFSPGIIAFTKKDKLNYFPNKTIILINFNQD